MKKFLALLVSAMLLVGMVNVVAFAEGEEIYYLNFKPEIADVYAKIAADYEAETGVKVKVETAAAGTYEQTLRSEIAKSDAPTIFQVNGTAGLVTQGWKDYAADLTDSSFYGILSDPSLALSVEGQVLAVPYAVEGYGIIFNNAIMEKYFASPNKKTEWTGMNQISDFATLKAVVEDMTAMKDELGIEGVFAPTSMVTGDDWRWHTHLMNMPLYYEMMDVAPDADPIMTATDAQTIEFKYAQNYKDIFDLYLDNSTMDKALLSSVTTDDSMAAFALGKCAMVQNGNWGASQILNVEGNTVKDEDIKFLPIFTGASSPVEHFGQGLCIGTENYLCINKNVSEEKQKASLDFLTWLFSSETGKKYVVGDLGFIAPFNTFGDNDKPSDPLSVEVMNWMSMEGTASVPWVFKGIPSEDWKRSVGDAMLEYAQGTGDWDTVVTTAIDNWAAERAMQ